MAAGCGHFLLVIQIERAVHIYAAATAAANAAKSKVADHFAINVAGNVYRAGYRIIFITVNIVEIYRCRIGCSIAAQAVVRINCYGKGRSVGAFAVELQ